VLDPNDAWLCCALPKLCWLEIEADSALAAIAFLTASLIEGVKTSIILTTRA